MGTKYWFTEIWQWGESRKNSATPPLVIHWMLRQEHVVFWWVVRVDSAHYLHLKQYPKVHVCLYNHAQSRIESPISPIADVVPAKADIHHVSSSPYIPLPHTCVGTSLYGFRNMTYQWSGKTPQPPTAPVSPDPHLSVPPSPPSKPQWTPWCLQYLPWRSSWLRTYQ